MASFPTTSSTSTSPSQTLTSLDPNASALSAGLRQRRNGAPPPPPDNSDPTFRGTRGVANSRKPAAATSLAAPPPRSSLCLQTNSADPVTPIHKSHHIAAGYAQPNRPVSHNPPFGASGLFSTTTAQQYHLSSSVSTLPAAFSSSSGATPSWVCVYGVDATIQELVLDRFSSYGRIVHQKSVGVNAVAFRYDSPLSAGKALCQNRFQIRGRYCGVFAMSDNDTSLLALETPLRMERNPANGGGATATPASLFAPSSTAAPDLRFGTGFAPAGNEQDADADIYVRRKPNVGRDPHHYQPQQQQQHESLCLRIMRWLLSAE
jgi:Nup53/35/40-type RNA recognition motif